MNEIPFLGDRVQGGRVQAGNGISGGHAGYMGDG